jgi:vacuolar-type H+-ATPase subunit E/Vma4
MVDDNYEHVIQFVVSQLYSRVQNIKSENEEGQDHDTKEREKLLQEVLDLWESSDTFNLEQALLFDKTKSINFLALALKGLK